MWNLLESNKLHNLFFMAYIVWTLLYQYIFPDIIILKDLFHT